ncbi:MAG: hypothetical protein GTN36_05520 [Candidatus Aenigmarchaeota archaeon]|nr:hypothetical protein [Candidatus Aenigmarchaeota archaeon]
MPKPSIHIQPLLDQSDISFSSIDESTGNYKFKSNNSEEEFELNEKELKNLVIETTREIDPNFKIPKDFSIDINTPETALDTESPLSLMERASLSFGNIKGKQKFLKEKFEDVKFTDKGIIVKDKGVWKQIDPTGLGNGSALDLAEEFAGDIADWMGETPIFAGALATSPTLAGTVGGASVGAGVKFAFGKMLGTYDASPEELVTDIGMEAALATLGYGVGSIATKVGPKMFEATSKVFNPSLARKVIPKNLDNMSNDAKDILASILNFTTRKSPVSINRLINNSDEVLKEMDLLIKNSPKKTGINEIKSNVILDSIRPIKASLQALKKTDSKIFEDLQEQIFKAKDINKYTFDGFDAALDTFYKELKENSAIADSFLKINPKTNQILGVKSESQIFKTIGSLDIDSSLAINDVRRSLQEVLKFQKRKSTQAASKGFNRGRKAAEDILEVKRAVQQLYHESDVSSKMQGKMSAPIHNFINKIDESFMNLPEAGKAYKKTMEHWKGTTDMINTTGQLGAASRTQTVNKILRSDKNIEIFINKLISNEGKNPIDKALFNTLEDYVTNKKLGAAHSRVFNKTLNKLAAADMYEKVPTTQNLAGAAALAAGAVVGTTATGGPLAGLATAGVAASVISPRFAARNVGRLLRSGETIKRAANIPRNVANKMLEPLSSTKEFIFRLSPKQKLELRSNPQLLNKLLAPIFAAGNEE